MTVLGTRPEIIRLSLVIQALDRFAERHVLVHTGQNYDDRLSRIFFEELEVRAPDERLEVKSDSFGGQVGQILERSEALFLKHRPDRLLILGDTNSGLSALAARRLGIPVYHMEAGNRCFDDRVPEEVNRRVIDHSSTVLMPYTHNGKENLLREGIPGDRIYVTGNPIAEVMEHFGDQIEKSDILSKLGLEPGGYFLVTLHRAENVDLEARLKGFIEAFSKVHNEFKRPIVCSFHPRTRSRVEQFGLDVNRKGLRFLDPFGFCDFVHLEQHAACILSDSGTVQEEACILGVANLTLRDVTERPETVECGSNLLTGGDPAQIVNSVQLALERGGNWEPPIEYLVDDVADTVCRILLGHRPPDQAELKWRMG